MATLADRVRTFLRSPRGQRLVHQARAELTRPDRQRRIRQLLGRLRRRG